MNIMNCSTTKTLLRAAARLSSRRLAFGNTTTNTIIRSYASAEMASGSTSSSSSSSPPTNYESPFDDFFKMIREGRSSLGTCDKTPIPDEVYLKCGVKESALRFRTMHYGRMQLAPHVQPGEHRVTLKLHTRDLPLNDMELGIVQQIVGNRLDLERGELRLASDQFGSRIENKRHLVTMLDRIVLGAKRLAKDLQQEEASESGETEESGDAKTVETETQDSNDEDTEAESESMTKVEAETENEKR